MHRSDAHAVMSRDLATFAIGPNESWRIVVRRSDDCAHQGIQGLTGVRFRHSPRLEIHANLKGWGIATISRRLSSGLPISSNRLRI